MVAEILKNRAVLPTAMKVLATHPGDRVVWKGVGLAVLCGHANKELLLRAALVQFGETLKEFSSGLLGEEE
jgi:hypothetical protein